MNSVNRHPMQSLASHELWQSHGELAIKILNVVKGDSNIAAAAVDFVKTHPAFEGKEYEMALFLYFRRLITEHSNQKSQANFVVERNPAEYGLEFSFSSTRYSPSYVPSGKGRETTNYNNLALNPQTRRKNIEQFFEMANSDLNRQLTGDAQSRRYEINIRILTAWAQFAQSDVSSFPLSEFMAATVTDAAQPDKELPGPTGLNFSSFIRDHDFSTIPANQRNQQNFGLLHGVLTQMTVGPDRAIPHPLVVAISISQAEKYQTTDHVHDLLGREYKLVGAESTTTQYFRKMGLKVQFYKPPRYPAPLAFYSPLNFSLENQTKEYQAALIAVMGNFQRIYRPEIYMAHTHFSDTPGDISSGTLENPQFTRTPVHYDRVERVTQGQNQASRVETEFLRPHAEVLQRIERDHSAP
jgi:hypothetical protein